MASRKARKRTFKRLSKVEQIDHLLGVADSNRVRRIPHELQLGQIERTPEEERVETGNPDADWATVRQREIDALARLEEEAKIAEARALELHGKPLPAKARRLRRERVAELRREELTKNIQNHERGLIDHETHLDRLDLTPKKDRDEDWEAEVEENDDALDAIEVAIEVASALLEQEGPPPPPRKTP